MVSDDGSDEEDNSELKVDCSLVDTDTDGDLLGGNTSYGRQLEKEEVKAAPRFRLVRVF